MKTILWNLIKSSQNPAKISLTLKSLGALLLFAAPLIGLTVSQEDTDNLVVVITALITALGTAVSSVGVIWGVIRKFKKPQA